MEMPTAGIKKKLPDSPLHLHDATMRGFARIKVLLLVETGAFYVAQDGLELTIFSLPQARMLG